MEISANPGKKLVLEVREKKYARYPIRTRFVGGSDSLEGLFSEYLSPLIQNGDIVVFCQKIVSLVQKRIVRKSDLRVGFWAKFLSKFAKKTPAGFSVGNPLKMQTAINLAGLSRILFACFGAALAKIFGVSGTFYRLAGHQISQIDGFYGRAFSQYSEIGILGPENCDQICQNLRNKFGFSFVVADINDLGGNILGRSQDLKGEEDLILEILKDNPATQSNSQTPIIIIREI